MIRNGTIPLNSTVRKLGLRAGSGRIVVLTRFLCLGIRAANRWGLQASRPEDRRKVDLETRTLFPNAVRSFTCTYGQKTVGFYSLFMDETCWFLAAGSRHFRTLSFTEPKRCGWCLSICIDTCPARSWIVSSDASPLSARSVMNGCRLSCQRP
jgi:hypothetical protein